MFNTFLDNRPVRALRISFYFKAERFTRRRRLRVFYFHGDVWTGRDSDFLFQSKFHVAPRPARALQVEVDGRRSICNHGPGDAESLQLSLLCVRAWARVCEKISGSQRAEVREIREVTKKPLRYARVVSACFYLTFNRN